MTSNAGPLRWIRLGPLLTALLAGPAQASDPPPEPPAAAAPAADAEPLYSLTASRQDAESLILGFARRARQSVTMLDRYSTRISVQFRNLPFEKALRRILLAADLGLRKEEDGYIVGLPSDLKLRFPDPAETVMDATYRCRRIDAKTLVETIKVLMGDVDIRAAIGPAFLTPEVEGSQGGGGGYGSSGGDLAVRALKPQDVSFRTHDVVFSGPPDKVLRALSLARKFDRPRKEVRVNVKIVQVSSSFTRNLGVDWMTSVGIAAVENTPTTPSSSIYGSSSTSSVVNGMTLGRFNHSPINLNATLNAMESSGKGRVLSNPTLLVLDGEKGFILSGTRYVYPKITTNSASGQPIYDKTEEKLGVYLQVSVQVGLDDDMVMSIYPQVSSLKQLQAISGGNYPIISTQEEQATVRAVRGDVIVLGGLTLDTATEDDAAVPFLARLPILGKLFQRRTTHHDTSELLFFLTPEIVDEVVPALDASIEVQPGRATPDGRTPDGRTP